MVKRQSNELSRVPERPAGAELGGRQVEHESNDRELTQGRQVLAELPVGDARLVDGRVGIELSGRGCELSL